jgi:hypothetical protein
MLRFRVPTAGFQTVMQGHVQAHVVTVLAGFNAFLDARVQPGMFVHVSSCP